MNALEEQFISGCLKYVARTLRRDQYSRYGLNQKVRCRTVNEHSAMGRKARSVADVPLELICDPASTVINDDPGLDRDRRIRIAKGHLRDHLNDEEAEVEAWRLLVKEIRTSDVAEQSSRKPGTVRSQLTRARQYLGIARCDD